MLVKKQHYYPRSLLKHFANDKKIYVYNREADLFQWTNYESICYHNKMYETEDIVDNVLEKRLSSYESQVAPIVAKIIREIQKTGDVSLSEEEINTIWNYMWIQTHRTDSGRILLIDTIENLSKTDRQNPVEIDEIKKDTYKQNRFNEIYKKEGALESLIKFTTKPESMSFHIALSSSQEECFITGDNPVTFNISKNGVDGFQMMMPISPYLYVEFQGKSYDSSDSFIVRMTQDKTRYVNRAIINVANYYVIASSPFDVALTGYIYNRFHKKDWTLSYPFVK